MTPLMTPAQTQQPQPPVMTPSLNAMGATPLQQQPPVATPQYQPTPRATFAPPTRTPAQSTNRAATNFTDWAKMAEMWASKRQGQKSRRTPRPEASPMGPIDPSTPGGGETPLFDER